MSLGRFTDDATSISSGRNINLIDGSTLHGMFGTHRSRTAHRFFYDSLWRAMSSAKWLRTQDSAKRPSKRNKAKSNSFKLSALRPIAASARRVCGPVGIRIRQMKRQ